MSIKQAIRKWLMSEDSKALGPEAPMASSRLDVSDDQSDQTSFTVLRAVNGRIIKVSTYKPNPRGPDWTHELYIVKDDEKIPDVIARIMAIKALEN
jgi:hypothetical protein